MKFTKMPTDTFKQLTVNAGVILKTFDPSDPKLTDTNILGATSGGVNVSITRTFEDYGSDIDNCPPDTKELKKCTAVAVKASGSFVTMSPSLAAMLAAAADIDSTNNAKVTLRRDLLDSDFSDLWIVGDYSDKNGEKNGGYIAIKLIAALSTGGFVVQTKDKGKATYSFEFTAHSSLTDQNTVPVDIYVQSGTAETTSNTGDGT